MTQITGDRDLLLTEGHVAGNPVARQPQESVQITIAVTRITGDQDLL